MWEQLVHFRDSRSPHEIKVQLARDLMTLFWPHRNGPQFSFKGEVKSGIPTRFELRFDAAFSWISRYTFRGESSWTSLPAGRQGGNASSMARSKPCPPNLTSSMRAPCSRRAWPHSAAGPRSRRPTKKAAPRSRPAGGSSFAPATGSPATSKLFDDEAAFVTFLRKFYDWETSKGFYPDKAPEFEAWKLILRLLRW